MPMAAKLPCRKYGCRYYQTNGGYCDEHQGLVKRIDYREAANKRGYDNNWTKFRAMYLRQHPVCNRCNRPASVPHHVVHLDNGGAKYDEDNLEPLCRECHEREHGRVK